jgi:pyridoxamine 5'-phosphate oxidase
VKEKDAVVSDLVNATPDNVDFTQALEPFALFEAWFAESAKSEINDPNAMALATADASGVPNVRMVLLKGLDPADHTPRGFVFYTNTTSAKGRELLANPNAALLFHWKSLQRQVRIKGAITQVSNAEADAYYASRPKGSRIGAWASQQSQPLASRAVLEQSVTDLEAKFTGDDIPRPPHWTGFRVTPSEIEFWHDRPYRLHDRIVFRRDVPTAPWSKTRLYP